MLTGRNEPSDAVEITRFGGAQQDEVGLIARRDRADPVGETGCIDRTGGNSAVRLPAEPTPQAAHLGPQPSVRPTPASARPAQPGHLTDPAARQRTEPTTQGVHARAGRRPGPPPHRPQRGRRTVRVGVVVDDIGMPRRVQRGRWAASRRRCRAGIARPVTERRETGGRRPLMARSPLGGGAQAGPGRDNLTSPDEAEPCGRSRRWAPGTSTWGPLGAGRPVRPGLLVEVAETTRRNPVY